MTRDIPASDDPKITTAVREWSAQYRRDVSAHLSTDRLMAYHDRELDEDETASVREHLALCPDCARRGLETAAFALPEQAGEPSELAAGDTGSDWGALRGALRREGLLPESSTSRPASRRPPSGEIFGTLMAQLGRLIRSPRFAYALAGFFFLTTVHFVAERPDDSPVANVALFDLFPYDAAQRDGAPVVLIPASAENLVLILSAHPDDLPAGTRYRAEIRRLQDPERPARRSLEELERTSDGTFTMRFPGGTLAPGPYEVTLYGPGGELLEEYRFEIEQPPVP